MSRTIITKKDLPGYYHWPLSVPTFTFLDKVKTGLFLLLEDRWTQGEYVKHYENLWKNKFDLPYAVMVSSGSTANELIALRRKHELEKAGEWPTRNKVVFPAITWISSISPWVNIGFEPVFADVNGSAMNSSYEDIKKCLYGSNGDRIGTVFYTSLLGFADVELFAIREMCKYRNVRFALDNCESSFSNVFDGENRVNINKFALSSTSLFFSHLTTTGTEGGMVFPQTEEENEWLIMARNHGMTRGLPEKYKNKEVDPAFDFNIMGSNYRSHNLAAFMGSLDFERAWEFSTNVDVWNSRIRLSQLMMKGLNQNYEKVHLQDYDDYVPFCLPIVVSKDAPIDHISKVKRILDDAKIERRPIVGGNLLHQTALKSYGSPYDFPRAQWIHENGVYIGLHHKITHQDIVALVNSLNNI